MNADADKGNRAEDVANWYFRLNGFFCLPAYIVHKDWRAEHPRTEADIIAVRFSQTKECIANKRLKDDKIILDACRSNGQFKNLFALVEVKSGKCQINGPWSRPEEKNIQIAIKRMGFAGDDQIDPIAKSLYEDLRWEDENFIVQYFCIGKYIDEVLQSEKNKLVQITFNEIASFFYARFQNFPQKIPICPEKLQWPGFGKAFASWFNKMGNNISNELCQKAVMNFINTGSPYYQIWSVRK